MRGRRDFYIFSLSHSQHAVVVSLRKLKWHYCGDKLCIALLGHLHHGTRQRWSKNLSPLVINDLTATEPRLMIMFILSDKHCVLLSLFTLVCLPHNHRLSQKLSIIVFQVSFLRSELWQKCVCAFLFRNWKECSHRSLSPLSPLFFPPPFIYKRISNDELHV